MPEALHLRLGVGQTDAAITVVIVDRIIRIFRQLFVEIDGVGLEPDHRLARAEIRYLGRRMPSGSARQFVAFHQDDIGPSLLCEVEEG